jgi:hypothetical protein
MLIIGTIGTFFGIILWNGNWNSLGILLATGAMCAAYASIRWATSKLAPHFSQLNPVHALRLIIVSLLLFLTTFFTSLLLPF